MFQLPYFPESIKTRLSLAGLLTCSVPRSLPIRNPDSGTEFLEIKKELTAAGLFRIFT